MSLDFIFSRPPYVPGDPLDFVFGGDGGGGSELPLTVQGTLLLGGLQASGTALYDNRLPGVVSIGMSARHQAAGPVGSIVGTPWIQPDQVDHGSASAWQSADRSDAATSVPWDSTARADTASSIPWQAAAPVSQARGVVYQACTPLDVLSAIGWQMAAPASVNLLSPHQVADVLEQLRSASAQQATPIVYRAYAPHQVATPAQRAIRARWQVAAQLIPPGLTVLVPGGGTGTDQHPVTLDLVFACPPYEPGAPLDLVFGHVCLPPVGPPALIVIPSRGTYMTYNAIRLRRVAGDIELNASSVDLSIDHRSWTWSWSAGLEASALSLLAPDDGDLVEMEMTINGVSYRLHAEDVERTRKFPTTRIAAGGRGLAAELDDPVALQQYFSAPSARTAQQLANEALTVNGVGIGWDVDWGLTDWLVPGGIWSHLGTHISAVSAIAAAAGGYVQPHATARTLRMLPLYPAAPWDWDGLTPDIELPAAPVTLEGIRWQSRPAYDRVFVSGDGQGTIWQITRAGTAGAVDAPMVVDQLATAVEAARQRGLSILGDTGRQAMVTLSLPVLAETGLILPGKLVRYVDGSTTRTGLVRSCAIEWRRPRLRQRISLETHI